MTAKSGFPRANNTSEHTISKTHLDFEQTDSSHTHAHENAHTSSKKSPLLLGAHTSTYPQLPRRAGFYPQPLKMPGCKPSSSSELEQARIAVREAETGVLEAQASLRQADVACRRLRNACDALEEAISTLMATLPHDLSVRGNIERLNAMLRQKITARETADWRRGLKLLNLNTKTFLLRIAEEVLTGLDPEWRRKEAEQEEKWWKEWEEADRRRSEKNEQDKKKGENSRQGGSEPPPPPLKISISKFQEWREFAGRCFADYSKMDKFPAPPARACGSKSCMATKSSRVLKACPCNIAAAFEAFSDIKVKVERVRWHPDKFSKRPEEHREVFQKMASEVFVILNR